MILNRKILAWHQNANTIALHFTAMTLLELSDNKITTVDGHPWTPMDILRALNDTKTTLRDTRMLLNILPWSATSWILALGWHVSRQNRSLCERLPFALGPSHTRPVPWGQANFFTITPAKSHTWANTALKCSCPSHVFDCSDPWSLWPNSD